MTQSSPTPNVPPWRHRRTRLFIAAAAVVFVGGVSLALAISGGRAPLRDLVSRHWDVLLGLVTLSSLNYVARTIRWQLFSGCAGLRVSMRRNALYFIAGFSMTVTPGKIGEAFRLWLLRRHHGYSYAQTTPVLIADRVSDAGAVVMLCLVSVGGFAGFLPEVMAALAAFVALMFLLVRPSALVRIVEAVMQRTRHLRRPLSAAEQTLVYVGRLHSKRRYGFSMPLALAGWIAEVGAFFWLLQTLGANVSFLQATFVFGFAMLVGAVAFFPGGLGGTEATMTGLLVALGVGIDVAVVATAVIRVATLWFAVGLGLVALTPALRSPSTASAHAGLGE